MTTITFTSYPKPETDTGENSPRTKVPGIRAIRCITKMDLRSAKAVLENLQENIPITVNDITDVTTQDLKTFSDLGGVYTIDTSLYDTIRKSIDIALNEKQFNVVIDLVNTLKKVN